MGVEEEREEEERGNLEKKKGKLERIRKIRILV